MNIATIFLYQNKEMQTQALHDQTQGKARQQTYMAQMPIFCNQISSIILIVQH